jgi:hypothetical protein
MNKKYIIILLLVSLLFACNKTKKINKKFIEAGEWKVRMEIDGVLDTVSAFWIIDKTQLEQDTAQALWFQANNNEVEFKFQFNNKGEDFYLYYQHQNYENSIVPTSAINCYNYSGKYSVQAHSKTFIQIESYDTKQYSGKQVVIKMNKN